MNKDMNSQPETGSQPREEHGGKDLKPAAPVKTRRVGTVTMALSLIATGTLIVLSIVFPKLDILTIIRFAPLVLVFLGIEILVAAFRFNNVKLKYDGLSIFISILLILGSAAASIVPDTIRLYENSYYTESRLTAELENRSYDILSEYKDEIHNVRWAIYTSQFGYDESMTVEDISADNQPQAQVYFNGGFSSSEEFAAKCHTILQELKVVCPSIRYASFYSAPSRYSYKGENYYSVWLDGIFQINWDENTIKENVNADLWLEDTSEYVDQDTYDDHLDSISDTDRQDMADENEADDVSLPEYLHISFSEPGTKGYTVEFEIEGSWNFDIDIEQSSGYLSVKVIDKSSGTEITSFDWHNETNESLNFSLNEGMYTVYIELTDFVGNLIINGS